MTYGPFPTENEAQAVANKIGGLVWRLTRGTHKGQWQVIEQLPLFLTNDDERGIVK